MEEVKIMVSFKEPFDFDDDSDSLRFESSSSEEKKPSLFVDIANQSKFRVDISDEAKATEFIESWCWKEWGF